MQQKISNKSKAIIFLLAFMIHFKIYAEEFLNESPHAKFQPSPIELFRENFSSSKYEIYQDFSRLPTEIKRAINDFYARPESPCCKKKIIHVGVSAKLFYIWIEQASYAWHTSLEVYQIFFDEKPKLVYKANFVPLVIFDSDCHPSKEMQGIFDDHSNVYTIMKRENIVNDIVHCLDSDILNDKLFGKLKETKHDRAVR